MNKKLALAALMGSLSGLPAFAAMGASGGMPVTNPYDRANGEINVAPLLQRNSSGATGQSPADSQVQSNFYKTPPNMKEQVSTEGFWEKDAPLFPKLNRHGRPADGQMDPETAKFLRNLQAFMAENDKQVKALGITISARKPVAMDRSPFAQDGIDSISVLAPSDSPRHIPDPLSLANSADSVDSRLSSGAL